MRGTLSLLVALLAATLALSERPALADLPPGVKPLEVMNMGVGAAEKLVTAGQRNEARLVLLGLAPIIQNAQGQVGPLLPRYEALMNALWEPLTAANEAAAVAAYKAAQEEFTAELTRHAIALDLFTPKDSMSLEQYANFLLKARESYPKAEACGVAYAAKAPSPLVHLKLGTQTSSFQILNYLQRILVSDGLWQPFMDKTLPRLLKKAEDEAAAVNVEAAAAHALLSTADHIRELVGYARAMDSKQAQLAPLSAKADALQKAAEEKIAKQTAENRLPGEGYKGDDLSALRAKLLAAYTKAFPNEKPLKLVIRSDNWVETAEAWTEGDTVRAGVFRWLEAAVAVEADGAEARVFYVRFGRQWTGKADEFGEPYYNRTSFNYKMLRANL